MKLNVNGTEHEVEKFSDEVKNLVTAFEELQEDKQANLEKFQELQKYHQKEDAKISALAQVLQQELGKKIEAELIALGELEGPANEAQA